MKKFTVHMEILSIILTISILFSLPSVYASDYNNKNIYDYYTYLIKPELEFEKSLYELSEESAKNSVKWEDALNRAIGYGTGATNIKKFATNIGKTELKRYLKKTLLSLNTEDDDIGIIYDVFANLLFEIVDVAETTATGNWYSYSIKKTVNTFTKVIANFSLWNTNRKYYNVWILGYVVEDYLDSINDKESYSVEDRIEYYTEEYINLAWYDTVNKSSIEKRFQIIVDEINTYIASGSTYDNIQWGYKETAYETMYCVDIFDDSWNMIYMGLSCGNNNTYSPSQLNLSSGTYHWKVWSPSGYGGDGFEGEFTVSSKCSGLPYLSTYEKIQWGCRGNDDTYCVDIFNSSGMMIYQGLSCGNNHSYSPSRLNLSSGTYRWKIWSPSGYGRDGFEGEFIVSSKCSGLSYLSTYEKIQWGCRGNDDTYCIDIFNSSGMMIYQGLSCGNNHSYSPSQLNLSSGTYRWKIWSPSGYGRDGFEGEFIVSEKPSINSPPTISGLSVPDSVGINELFRIQYSYSDPDGLYDVVEHRIIMSDAPYFEIPYPAGGAGMFSVQDFYFSSLGQQWVKVYVVDSAGNRSNVLTKTLNVINQSTICPMNYDPVCGSDGKTYSNSCVAQRAGVYNYYNGECSNARDDIPYANSPPTISGLSIPDSVGINEYFRIQYSYSDPDGLYDVVEHRIIMSDAPYREIPYPAGGAGMFSMPGFYFSSPGQQWVKVYVVDSTGNKSNELTKTLNVVNYYGW